MEFYSTTKKKEILSFANKWMKLDSIILSEVSQPNIVCLPSYVYHRSKTNNSNIIGCGSHAKGRACTGGIGKGKET
jgi:hypothetical protein